MSTTLAAGACNVDPQACMGVNIISLPFEAKHVMLDTAQLQNFLKLVVVVLHDRDQTMQIVAVRYSGPQQPNIRSV